MDSVNTVQLRLSASPDELSVEDSITLYEDVIQGFTRTLNGVVLKPNNFDKFIELVKQKYPEIKEYNFDRNKNQTFRKYIGSKVRIYVQGNSNDYSMNFSSVDDDNMKILWDFYSISSPHESEVEIYMNSFYMSGNSVDSSMKIMKPSDFMYLSEKYYPYIDTSVMFDQFFTGSENILVVVGEPGLGKSKLSTLAIKYAYLNPSKIPNNKMDLNAGLEEQFITIALVKSNEVLASDSFWNTLEGMEADFVIMDDLDYMLTKRDSEILSGEDAKKNMFLNQLLSFTDGVKKHKTKFIITTNQKFDEIDSAILRKGRLFDILELRKLDKAEGLEIWKEADLEEEEFNKLFSTHEIIPANLGSEISKMKNNCIKNATIGYLKEDGISKVQKAGRVKKIRL